MYLHHKNVCVQGQDGALEVIKILFMRLSEARFCDHNLYLQCSLNRFLFCSAKFNATFCKVVCGEGKRAQQ